MRIVTTGVVGAVLLIAGAASGQNVIRLGDVHPAADSMTATLKSDGQAQTQQISWGRRFWGGYPGYGYGYPSYHGYRYPSYGYGYPGYLSYGYGYPSYGYGYPTYGYGYPSYGYGFGSYPGYGYSYGYPSYGYSYGSYPGYGYSYGGGYSGYWGISGDGQSTAAVLPIQLQTAQPRSPSGKFSGTSNYKYRAYGE